MLSHSPMTSVWAYFVGGGREGGRERERGITTIWLPIITSKQPTCSTCGFMHQKALKLMNVVVFIRAVGGVLTPCVTLCVHVCMYVCDMGRGSLHTSQISHLLLYPSPWLLVPELSSQFLPIQLAFDGWQYLWEMATRFCNLREPLYRCMFYWCYCCHGNVI